MLIGLCGFAQSGKDEFAHALARLNYKRVAFADEVKKDCQAFIDNKFPGQFDVINNVAHKKAWRKFLVGWGDNARVTDEDYWIRRMVRANLTDMNRPELNILVTDVRYLNEATWVVKEKNGLLIRVHRYETFPANETERDTIAEIDKSNLLRHDFYNDGDNLAIYHKKVIEFMGGLFT